MNVVYPVTFHLPNGATVKAKLVSPVSLAIQRWTLTPQPDGWEYSGTLPSAGPVWASIPDMLDQAAAFDIDIRALYCTPIAGTTVTMNGTLPAGFAYNPATCHLTYDGVTKSAVKSLTWTALNAGISTISPLVPISGAGASIAADTSAPTIPIGLQISGITTTSAVLSGYACSDPSPPNQQWSGMASYLITIPGMAGSPFTVLCAAGNRPALNCADLGSVPTPTTYSQNGADVTMTGCFGSSLYSTGADSCGFACQQLSAPSWFVSTKVVGFAGVVPWSFFALMARTSLASNSKMVLVASDPAGSAAGIFQRVRQATGGDTTDLNANVSSVNITWLGFARNVDTYTSYYSVDGINFIPIGSVTVVLGSTVYVGAALQSSVPTKSVNCTFQQLNIQTNPSWSLPFTGLPPGSSYNYSVQAVDGVGNASMASAIGTFMLQASGGGGSSVLFPRIGWQGLNGSQMPTSATLNQLAQYQYCQLGGPYAGAVGGAKLTRDQAVVGLKGQTLTGKNALLPLVGNYEIIQYNNGLLAEWLAICNARNWWCWQVGSSGINTNKQNFARVVGTDPTTGYYPGQWAAQYLHDRYYTGGGLATATNGAQFASSNLDFIYIDSQGIYLPASGDWRRIGSSQGIDDTQAIAAYCQGMVDYATKLRALSPSKFVVANTSYGYATLPTTGGGRGDVPGQYTGLFDYPMQQFVFGHGVISAYQQGDLPFSLKIYKQAMLGASAASGACTVTGAFTTTDWALLRTAMCTTLLDNGILVAGLGGDASNSGADGIDPSTPSTFPVCDEFWGGSLNLAGFLGRQAATNFGPPPSSAWSNGVQRRDFEFGIVLQNLTNAPQTITPGGGTRYHLNSVYGSQGINNRSAVSGAMTLPAYEGCLLMTSQPP